MRLDNSMITTFKQQCERKFFYRYVHDLVRTGSEGPLRFGEGIHKALDCFFLEKPVVEAIEAFKQVVPEDLDEKRRVDVGEAIIRDYYNEHRTQAVEEVLGIEKSLSLQIGDVEFWGKIDKIVRWMYGIAGLDHKTTSLYLTTYAQLPTINHQFTGYTAILKELYPDAYGFIVDAVHVPRPLKSGEIRTDFQRIAVSRSERDLQEWREFVRSSAVDIERAHDNGLWRKFDNDCHSFNRACPYKELCEYGSNVELAEVVEYAKECGDFEERKWEPWLEDAV